jgi:hypothetical protein
MSHEQLTKKFTCWNTIEHPSHGPLKFDGIISAKMVSCPTCGNTSKITHEVYKNYE